MVFHGKIIGTSWGKHMYTTSNELEKDKEAWTTGWWSLTILSSWKTWKSMGRIIPYIMENKTWLKPQTSYSYIALSVSHKSINPKHSWGHPPAVPAGYGWIPERLVVWSVWSLQSEYAFRSAWWTTGKAKWKGVNNHSTWYNYDCNIL